MSDSKKPKLSEIRARTARACEKGQYHYFPAASHALFHDIPDLLDLVSRMGKLAELILTETNPVNVLGPPEVTHEMEKKARALLEELEL